MSDPENNQNIENTNDNLQIQEPLPHSTAILVMGIFSVIGGCCCAGIPGLLLAIITLVLASKSEKEFEENPGKFLEKSLKNLNTGRIFAYVGLGISILMLITYIYLVTSGRYEEFEKMLEEWQSQGMTNIMTGIRLYF